MEFLEIFHQNYQFRPIKIGLIHLFTIEKRFCKFSVVSVVSNWLYSLERKARKGQKF